MCTIQTIIWRLVHLCRRFDREIRFIIFVAPQTFLHHQFHKIFSMPVLLPWWWSLWGPRDWRMHFTAIQIDSITFHLIIRQPSKSDFLSRITLGPFQLSWIKQDSVFIINNFYCYTNINNRIHFIHSFICIP